MNLLVNGEVSVVDDAVMPSIKIPIEVDYRDYAEAPINVSGFLKDKDGRIICSLQELDKPTQNSLQAYGTAQESRIRNSKYAINMVAELTERTLAHIEEIRSRNPLSNVELKVSLIVTYLESNMRESPFWRISSQQIPNLGPHFRVQTSRIVQQADIVAYAPDNEYSSFTPDMHVLSGNGGPEFLTVRNAKMETAIIIKSSDWIQIFSPKLGLHRYIVFEVPVDNVNLKEALEYISKAEKAYLKWDTEAVFANCREMVTNLDNKMRDKYKDDSFDYKEKWGRAAGAFKHFASLDLHKEDFKRQYDKVNVTKEYAESLLNMSKVLLKFASEMLE